jgi:predicted dinucleotide-binding enzyme
MREERMTIAVLGADHVGSKIGRLWKAGGHDVTFAARHPAAGAGRRTRRSRYAASVADAVAAAEAGPWPSRPPLSISAPKCR